MKFVSFLRLFNFRTSLQRRKRFLWRFDNTLDFSTIGLATRSSVERWRHIDQRQALFVTVAKHLGIQNRCWASSYPVPGIITGNTVDNRILRSLDPPPTPPYVKLLGLLKGSSGSDSSKRSSISKWEFAIFSVRTSSRYCNYPCTIIIYQVQNYGV